MSFQFRARLEVLHYTVTFETNWLPAYNYLKHLDSFFHIDAYRFIESQTRSEGPIVQYKNEPEYRCIYMGDLNTLVVSAPWEELPRTTDTDSSLNSLLLVPIWCMMELERQRLGEYFFHASAVVRDGCGIILSGPAETGKTVVALDLCLNYGFSLYANDEVLVGLYNELPHLRIGDPEFRFRFSSLRKYNPKLAADIFGSVPDVDEPWNIKRQVAPADLGIQGVHGTFPVSLFVFLKLEDEASNVCFSVIDGSDRDALFQKQIQFHTEMSGPIRCGAYAPIDGSLKSVPFFLPSLDRPEFLRRRIIFIEALFGRRCVISLRGPLKAVTERLDQCIRNLQESFTDVGR